MCLKNLEIMALTFMDCFQVIIWKVVGLNWDTMLKMTKIKLEVIPDPDMCIFFEKCRRGGISFISNRYSKVTNNYLKIYDSKQEYKHIIYLDTNNSYGYTMSKFLQTSGFKRILKRLTWINILAIVQKDEFSNLILNIQKN